MISKEEIIEMVLLRLDESPEVEEDGVEYGSPWFDLRKIIEKVIPFAATEEVMQGDMSEVNDWTPLTGNVVTEYTTDGKAMRLFRLPADFGRFLFLRMSDWSEAVTELIQDDGVRSLRSYWRYRGGRQRETPALNYAYRNGGRVLEIFGSVAGSRVAEGGYIPHPRWEGDSLVFPASKKGDLINRIVEIIKETRG